MCRRPVDADQFAQDFDDAVRTNASGDIDRKTIAGKFIDHRQTFQLLTIGAGVEHKIVGPDLVGSRSRQRARPATDPSMPPAGAPGANQGVPNGGFWFQFFYLAGKTWNSFWGVSPAVPICTLPTCQA
jgi:hypothetical protein